MGWSDKHHTVKEKPHLQFYKNDDVVILYGTNIDINISVIT